MWEQTAKRPGPQGGLNSAVPSISQGAQAAKEY